MTGVTVEADAAARQQAGMDFVGELVASGGEDFHSAFSDEGEQLTDPILVERAANALSVLSNRLRLREAAPVYHFHPGSTGEIFPAVRAGWAELEPVSAGPDGGAPDELIPHSLNPTEAGLLAINGWRKARGDTPLVI